MKQPVGTKLKVTGPRQVFALDIFSSCHPALWDTKFGIITDGAKNFSSQLSNTFTAVLGLQQFRISPYNAKSNPAERINRAILSGLRCALQQHQLQPEVFKNLIHYIVLAWNTSVLSHIKFSPYQLFLSTSDDNRS